ncbi:MAG: RNA-splicing ligase RtcB [Candidatus Latescibacterota bacterium]|nr:MAG: RNA-splicing ligase RtcB [Candidatus Latescibacterota bacterium]
MLEYQGKHNKATVMVDSIDPATVSQIFSFLNHPAFAEGRIVVMPDCHAGKGSCIGFTAPLGGMVIPNVVGVDIGCGMAAVPLPDGDIDFEKFDEVIRRRVPYGFRVHETPDENLEWLRSEEAEAFLDLSCRVGQKPGWAIESLGTLGGGNHFIEVDEASPGNRWMVVHSGSRNLGLCVAEYHQAIARKNFDGIGGVPKGLEYLEGDEAAAYVEDMRLAQQYAEVNRLFILCRVLDDMFGIPWSSVSGSVVLCAHNFISPDDGIIRKGAISAHWGEKVVIPLNMRDGIIFGTGKGNEEWNWSAPHGAGRLMSRGKAERTLSVEDFEKEMEGVWTSCVGRSTLDEAPGAYKSSEAILDVIHETVEVDFVAKPVYNFKAS